jgi:transcription initiation factor IIE alpha subunit
MSMNLEEFTKEKLWLILVDTVHKVVMYPSHKAYIRDVILRDKPDVTPTELANRLNMPLGEALVILYELVEERKSAS